MKDVRKRAGLSFNPMTQYLLCLLATSIVWLWHGCLHARQWRCLQDQIHPTAFCQPQVTALHCFSYRGEGVGKWWTLPKKLHWLRCMCKYVLYIYIHMSIYIYICTYRYVYIFMYVYNNTSIFIHIVCMCIYTIILMCQWAYNYGISSFANVGKISIYI